MKLLDQILLRENMKKALRKVQANKGAAGIDGVSTEQLLSQLQQEWAEIKIQIEQGTYKPQPVLRVEIPKPGGGIRLLGIPTVTDRLIQQAILQVLTPIFDPGFSESSYGFRPNKGAKDAVKQAQKHILEGRRIVVDLDIEKFFDRVNHDILMSRVARKVEDKQVLKLIRAYLNSGVMVAGVKTRSDVGTPQGGPLSPLLANILLDDLDKELENRGHKFCRYADDCNIYVHTERAGQRVKDGIQNYLKKKLKLKVNEEKSAVDMPFNRKFLGFSFTREEEPRIKIAPESIKRLKNKVRQLTNPNWSISMEERIRTLNQYLMGWLGYYALIETPSILKNLEGWIRRRLRLCQWLQWKRVKTRIRELRALGLAEKLVFEIANIRKGAWRATRTFHIHKALNNAFWQSRGLKSLVSRYFELRQHFRTA